MVYIPYVIYVIHDQHCLLPNTYTYVYVLNQRNTGLRLLQMIYLIRRYLPKLQIVHFTTYTIKLTLYNLHYTTYTIQLTLYNLHCTTYIVQLTLYNLHCTTYIVQLTLYNLHCTTYIVQLTLYNLHCTTYIVRCIRACRQLKLPLCIAQWSTYLRNARLPSTSKSSYRPPFNTCKP